ncbi:phosphotransferase, partial [Accumulibacter sp.]|uniref:phosphotransferase n=1 Tax=Accumulibacter sp. TaxID=2053492 RepID=UPI002D1FB189
MGFAGCAGARRAARRGRGSARGTGAGAGILALPVRARRWRSGRATGGPAPRLATLSGAARHTAWCAPAGCAGVRDRPRHGRRRSGRGWPNAAARRRRSLDRDRYSPARARRSRFCSASRRQAGSARRANGPRRICHGDLKLNNLRFAPRDADPAVPPRGVCLLDLDTLAELPLAFELGDALRSWYNPAATGEDQLRTRFDLELLEQALHGYGEHGRRFL